jgi:lipopolysaccharide/colanic/teichoic acid biosynthesis glycosyltransferase
MLVQMPRGFSRGAGENDARENSQFEIALRRDLAGGALISYNPVVGGWSKRIFDLAVLIFFAPAWLTLLAAQVLTAKRRKAPAFAAREYVGYGAKVFTCSVAYEAAANDADDPAVARARRRALYARLGQVWSVLRGDMSLVGPAPLTTEEVAALRNGVRHYLSMRPGMFGIAAIFDADAADDPAHYRAYAMSWSALADAVILWQELCGLLSKD